MVVRLVRAGVGALLLLIAVPLALAGGGLLLAMEHRAADRTFTARLEPVHADGAAVVVPDVDALLRADAPFARGGQTTLSLSALGSGGPLFIGLGPRDDVQRYLDGLAQTRVTRVRLARGPLPVEVQALPARSDGAVAADATVTVTVDAQGNVLPSAAAPTAAAPLPAPGGQLFWLARSEPAAGAARLSWSPSATRGRHLALVVMRADGTAGVDATITARLSPAWLAPTTGGLLMLGTALFLLAMITLAWPTGRRSGEPEPAVDADTDADAPAGAAAEGLAVAESLADASASASAGAAKPDAVAKPAKTGRFGKTAKAAVKSDAAKAPAKSDAQAAAKPDADGKVAASAEPVDASPVPAQPTGESREEPVEPPAEDVPVPAHSPAVMATLADVLAEADAEVQPQPEMAKGKDRALAVQLPECELDRPAPVDGGLDEAGAIELPPLPPMPAIDLHFTWAPIEVDEPAEEAQHAATGA